MGSKISDFFSLWQCRLLARKRKGEESVAGQLKRHSREVLEFLNVRNGAKTAFFRYYSVHSHSLSIPSVLSHKLEALPIDHSLSLCSFFLFCPDFGPMLTDWLTVSSPVDFTFSTFHHRLSFLAESSTWHVVRSLILFLQKPYAFLIFFLFFSASRANFRPANV